MKKIIGIVPARLAATRFPNKPLKDICGIPMLQHVFERSNSTKTGHILQLLHVIKRFTIFQKKINIHQFKPLTSIPDV